MKPRFLIAAPGPNPLSGGVRALYKLCDMMNAMGEDARMMPLNVTRRLHPERAIIAVYPEVMGGPGCDADLTVRWLLCTPGVAAPDVSATWGTDDLLFSWREFSKMPGRPCERLDFSLVDETVFNRDWETHRGGRLLYSRKARLRGIDIAPEHADCYDIIGERERRGCIFTDTELAGLFRSATELVCYEPTLVALEARLCGCPVTYHPNALMPYPPYDWTPVETQEQFEARWAADKDQDMARVFAFVQRCYAEMEERHAVA